LAKVAHGEEEQWVEEKKKDGEGRRNIGVGRR
jgi:hypothetical protein